MAIDTTTTSMETITRPSRAASVGLLFLRIPLGVLFVIAGISKFTMQGGAGKFVEYAMPKATKFMSDNLAHTFLTSLPYAEIALGAFLIMGLVTRVVAALTALLLVGIIIGETGFAAPNQPMHPNVIYTCVAVALVLCGGGWISVDGVLFRPRRRIVVDDTLSGGITP